MLCTITTTHEPLEKNRLILYISSGNNKPIIWPDFTGMPLQHVVEFLDNYNIEPHIIHDDASAIITSILN